MTELALLLASLLLAMIVSEVALGGDRLPTRTMRPLLVFGVIGGADLAYLTMASSGSIMTVVVFWMGAFLSWFGIRSHLQSSILLRMVCTLREQQLSAAELRSQYEADHDVAERLAELQRSGLVQHGPDGPGITRKGQWILHIVAWLR